MENNRNTFLAIALSFAVLFGWQYLYVGPARQKARLQEVNETLRNAAKPSPNASNLQASPANSPAVQQPSGAGIAFASREEAIAATPRVALTTPELKGSINLKGGRIDDVVLRGYTETVNPDSPKVVLLSPSSSPHPYFALTGWLAPSGTPVPDSNTVWEQEGSGSLTPDHPVVLRWDNGQGLIFRRTISVDSRYMFTVADEVENKSDRAVSLQPWAQVARLTEPKTLGYSVLHEGLIAGLGKDGIKDVTYSSALKNYVPADPAQGTFGHPKETYADTTGGWAGFTDQYWATVVIPDSKSPYGIQLFGNEDKHFYANAQSQAPLTVEPGARTSVSTRIFAGAKQVDILNDYQHALGIERFDYLIDWGWFPFLTGPMLFLMNFFYQHVGNFGVAIMLTTVLVKLLFFPLANKSYESMSKMKKLQPEMKRIQERFKDDKARQQQALMELYRKEKVNPMAGCLPILIQVPVFFSIYKVLLISIGMRHAPFIGWIHDLSAPDPTSIFNLFGLLPWTPPAFLMIGGLPLLLGISMWVQMRLTPTPPDPVQQQVFTYMPVVMTFVLGQMPAGLVLYWTWNNILSFGQQALIMKRQGTEIDITHNLGLKKMHGRMQRVSARLRSNGRSRTPAE